jgi:REP element-mobilizing transposase RayT
MARPLRIEYPGAYYHVINRGNQRNRVFYSDKDYELFLDRLSEFADIFDVRVLSYCGMPNHFHLYVKTSRANLSRFMQGFLSSFCIRMNWLRKKSGHIFQGRFKAQLVENERYSAEVSRYIHLNPVRATLQGHISLAEKRQILRRYAWSSYPSLIGIRKSPDWLSMEILSFFQGHRSSQMKAYRSYVEEGLLRNIKNPFEALKWQSILGSDSFTDQIKRRYILKQKKAIRKEQPSLWKLQQFRSVQDVTKVVGQICRVDVDAIKQSKGRHSDARRLLIYCICKYCRGERSLSDISREFSVSVSGLTQARDRFERAVKYDKLLQQLLAKVEKRLECHTAKC